MKEVGAVINTIVIAIVSSMLFFAGLIFYLSLFISYFYRPITGNDLMQCLMGLGMLFVAVCMIRAVNLHFYINITRNEQTVIVENRDIQVLTFGPLADGLQGVEA